MESSPSSEYIHILCYKLFTINKAKYITARHVKHSVTTLVSCTNSKIITVFLNVVLLTVTVSIKIMITVFKYSLGKVTKTTEK